MSKFNAATAWQEVVTIPTYLTGKPNKNPMFLEKRVYQGSSGKVYPHSVIDNICDEKVDKQYTALYLENDFIKVMILPELGGRIQRAIDKTNGYDFVYYNHVIKPALVGLAGPWISGGIEFNWPQHHRPSTFDPTEYTIQTNADGSATVIVAETENMFRTRCVLRFTVYPNSAYIEIKSQLYNRTDIPQTFLWWANPALAVNDNTRTIFPPDVTAVMDHGKRAVSTFPIATGTYYKTDYSAGVDISRYKNIPVPTSYMAAKSDFDFVGGYDDGLQAGTLHVADHHISPGKKQWTWGNGDFGQAWDRNLTDSDGPYVELMTGCFTDNQPDFTWLMPLASKTFTQYFMPYKKLGTVHNANENLAMNVENEIINLYAFSELGEITLKAYKDNKVFINKTLSLGATDFVSQPCQKINPDRVEIIKDGKLFLAFDTAVKKHEIPDAATPAPCPQDCATNEDLFLYGLHIEQYRHATYRAEDYYLEGLKRDKTDIRINNAYGKLLLKAGKFKESQTHFEQAIAKAIRSNPNPYDSEPYFNLGICLFYQEKYEQAYDAFYKATWGDAFQEAFYYLACIQAINNQYPKALEFVEKAITKNALNTRALNLKTLLLDLLGESELAKNNANNTINVDPLDVIANRYLGNKLTVNYNTIIECAIEYASSGFYNNAVQLLEEDTSGYPMIAYYLTYYYDKLNNTNHAEKYAEIAQNADSYCCFPHRLQDMIVLDKATAINNKDGMAYYYLGNLYFDKYRYDNAVECYSKCVQLCPTFPTAYRNLALLYYNVYKDAKMAIEKMEQAFTLDQSDARVLMELDQLYKKVGKLPKERIEFLEKHSSLINQRDDLLTEYITLLNCVEDYTKACQLMSSHNFHPWEGGEGKITTQYVYALCGLAQQAINRSEFDTAKQLIEKTYAFPFNLGEGKLAGAQDNLQNLMLGQIYQMLGDNDKANQLLSMASVGLEQPQSSMYYNDQPSETIFCQGLALEKLGLTQKAEQRFNKLVEFADEHINEQVKIDYFAVSLPDFIVFDDCLELRNKTCCLFMKALGQFGLKQKDAALKTLNECLQLNGNQPNVIFYKNMFFKN